MDNSFVIMLIELEAQGGSFPSKILRFIILHSDYMKDCNKKQTNTKKK